MKTAINQAEGHVKAKINMQTSRTPAILEKIMTARRIALGAGLLVTWLTAGPAQAVLINWDFAGDKPSGAAVIGTAGDYWNQGNNPNLWSWWGVATITGAPSILNDSTNTITTVGLTLYSKDVRTADGLKTHNTNTPTNFHAAFDGGYGYPGNLNPMDYTITGLTAGSRYDVYVLYGWGATTAGLTGDIYAYGGTTRGGNGTTKQTVTYATATANPVLGRDYVLFSGVVATGGAINICSRNFSDQDNGVTGFQIESALEDLTWTGGTDAWATAGNWTPAGGPPVTRRTAIFNGTGNGNKIVDLGTGVTVKGITFDTASTGDYTIGKGTVGSQTLTLDAGGSIAVNSLVTANQTINANVVLGSASGGTAYTFTNGSTTTNQLLTLAGALSSATTGTKTLTVNGAGNTQIGGNISNGTEGTLALTKSGAGTLTLSGTSNTYTGLTTVSGGTLAVSGGSGRLGNAAALTMSGGALDLATTSQTVGAVSITAAAASGDTLKNGDLTGTSYAASNTTGNAIVSANLLASGSAGFAMGGAGTATLAGANTFTGGVTISAGTLQLGSTGALNSTAGSENAVAFGASTTGTLSLNGNSVTLANLTGSAVGPIVQNASTTPATLTIGNSSNLDGTYAGILQNGTGGGALSLIKAGTGTLTLSGVNTYSGATVISGGTLKLSGGQAVSVALTNPSFETDAGTANGWQNMSITGWTKTAGGIEQGSSRIWAPAAPPNYNASTNFKWAWIQGAQTMSQTINVTTPGVYTVGFAAAGRPGGFGPLNIQVQIDGVNQSAVFTPSTSAWATYNSDSVPLSAGSHTLGFVCINALGGDRASVLDAVTVTGTATGGNLPATTSLSIADGSTLDLNGTAQTVASLSVGGLGAVINSAAATPATLTLTSGITLSANSTMVGTGTGAGNLTIALGSGQPITLTYDGSTPALSISQGTLSLNNNPFTINGSLLADGNYNIVTATAITDGSTTYPIPTGTALTGKAASITVSGVYVVLNVSIATPPTWVPGWPKADTATSTGFTARAKANEAGNAYYVVVAGGATAPTAAQVKAGHDSTGLPALKSGTLALTADTENSDSVTGLSPGTLYDVWFVAEDDLQALQAAPSMVSVTTHTTFAEWIGTFSGVGVHTGLTDDADFDGMKNFVEFALNSSPADGSTQGKDFLKLATVGGTSNVLTLTVAARSGASFSAEGNNLKAVVASDALTYLIEASTTLGDWGTPVVTEVTGDDATAIQATLTPSAPGTGWTYHTFRTAGSAATHAGEFIHVKVTSP